MKMFRRLHEGEKARGGESGFTLMEVLIAVAILAIGVLGVVNVFPVGLQAASRAADFTRVSLLVQSAVDFYRGEGYGRVHDMFENADDYGGLIYEEYVEGVGMVHVTSFIPDVYSQSMIGERGGGMREAAEFDEYDGFFWRIAIYPDVHMKAAEPNQARDLQDAAGIYRLILHVYWLDRGQEQWEPFEFHIAKHD